MAKCQNCHVLHHFKAKFMDEYTANRKTYSTFLYARPKMVLQSQLIFRRGGGGHCDICRGGFGLQSAGLNHEVDNRPRYKKCFNNIKTS